MAELTIGDDGEIMVTGEGLVSFDPKQHPKLLVAGIRRLLQGHEFSLPELFPMLTPSAKDLLREAADNEPLASWFINMSQRFATIGAANGECWTRKEIEVAWCRVVKTWMIDEVIKAKNGLVFVRLTQGGLMSEDEFYLIEGKSVEEHLDEFVQATTYAVAEIKSILRAELITREVQAVNREGAVETITLTGPDVISIDQWAHPPGYTLLCSEYTE